MICPTYVLKLQIRCRWRYSYQGLNIGGSTIFAHEICRLSNYRLMTPLLYMFPKPSFYINRIVNYSMHIGPDKHRTLLCFV